MTVAITPETRVGALLDAYPDLEARLMELAPAFKKLKNPILRRTVAKVATLAQAARVAGLSARELVSSLRAAAGQTPLDDKDVSSPEGTGPNAWLDSLPIAIEIDAEQVLATGTHPLQMVNAQLSAMGHDQAILIRSTFLPAPLIDAVTARGFVCRVVTIDGVTQTRIAHGRPSNPVSA